MHQIIKQNVRLYVANAARQTLTTHDSCVVTLSVLAAYRIDDLVQLYRSVHNLDNAIGGLMMGVAADVVSQSTAATCTAETISMAVRAKLQALDWGLEFVDVQLNDFALAPLTVRLIGDHTSFYPEQPSLTTGDNQ
jgi:regulator of protease activity HflC (stomatin/prohibitin superfamily)